MICSSTSKAPGTTPRTARNSGCSTCSASSTRPTPTPGAGPGTPRSGPSTGRTRSAPSRNWSTSSPNGAGVTPGLHVYHYNHYEPTSVDHLTELHGTRQEAVGRLMGRFATREDEVDDLFRRGVFVDLYRVVRQGVRAGVESYSIKRLEPLVGYARQMDLRRGDREPDRLRGGAGGSDRPGRRGDETGRRRLQRGRLPGHARAPRLAGAAARRAGASAGRGPAAARSWWRSRATTRIPRSPGSGRRCWRASRRSVGADRRAEGEGAAGRPARLAPPRGQAGLVAVLPRPHAERAGAGRRAGRAGRPDRRGRSRRR